MDALVALMTDDVWVRTPPVPLEYEGRELAGRFFSTIAFRQGRRYRLVATRANGQPAFGVYLRDPMTEVAHAFSLLVITLARRSGQHHHPLRQRRLPTLRATENDHRLRPSHRENQS